MSRVHVTMTGAALAMAIFAVAATPVSAQGLLGPTTPGPAAAASDADRLLVDAKEIVYDNDRSTVSASGDVQVNYKGRAIQADRVTYDRKSGRVFAEGDVRLTEADGSVTTGDRFELSEDFKNGFIDSLRLVQTTDDNGTPVTARFSAPRAERRGGETTIFDRATYTVCEPCKENPERPPLWQVKAARVIHNSSEKTIYYENASLEFLGVPIAYVPYFWTPDPTVTRKTGFLAPGYVVANSLGFGVSTPFFWAIAPNYDLTVTPTFLSRQGVLGEVEWRHRLINGSYNIRAAGIIQLDPGAFLPGPLGAGDREARGSIESAGQFDINERWTWGWNVALLSDRWFLANYRIKSESLSTIFLKESISTLYLQGLGDRSWFDLRGYYFRGLSSYDWQRQQPVVHPVLDYNRRFNGPGAIGGEIAFDANVTSLSRDAAQYEEIPRQVTKLVGLYDTCSVFSPDQCIVRGVSGTTTRASVNLSWRRQYIDSIGQSWTPFAYVRADGFSNDLDFNGYQNPQLANFITADDTAARLMPAIGLEYRFPLVASLGPTAAQVIEPIAQVIARPNETRIGRVPNEDAQSLVFDDTSLFDWDKFSGYDRVEGGVRANLGAQYTVRGNNGLYANVLFGQSLHLAGLNSFQPGDLANVGRDSGLESRRSDYVGRLQFAPTRNVSFVARGRFDESNFDVKRFEAGVTGNFAPWAPISASLMYANYASQPELGQERAREGLLASARWNFTPNWFVSGATLFDLDRWREKRDDPLAMASLSLGLGYSDECTVFTVGYTVTPKTTAVAQGERDINQTFSFTLVLRTLAEATYAYTDGSAATEDGIAAQ